MDMKQSVKNNKGFSTTIFIIGFALFIGGLLLLYYLFAIYMNEIEAFYDDATVDCYMASKAAIVQLKNEYEKLGYTGVFDKVKCKEYFRNHLADTFMLEKHQEDTMMAKPDNRFIKYLEIKEYTLNDNNEITSLIYITARPYFYSAVFNEPVYKLSSSIKIDKITH